MDLEQILLLQLKVVRNPVPLLLRVMMLPKEKTHKTMMEVQAQIQTDMREIRVV